MREAQALHTGKAGRTRRAIQAGRTRTALQTTLQVLRTGKNPYGPVKDYRRL